MLRLRFKLNYGANMITLKRNFLHCHFNDSGMVEESIPLELYGIFFADVRLLRTYCWKLKGFELLQQSTNRSGKLVQYWGDLAHHFQKTSLIRQCEISENSLTDKIIIQNHSMVSQKYDFGLDYSFDDSDLMSLRNVCKNEQITVPSVTDSGYRVTLADDSFRQLELVASEDGVKIEPSALSHIQLEPGQIKTVLINLTFSSDQIEKELPDYQSWMSCQNEFADELDSMVQQSLDDLYGLLFSTPDGLIIAAGLPRFAAPFGRDSLITAMLLLESKPELAKGTLRWLARHIGQSNNSWNDEEPGKILHEYRWGPDSQSKQIPFAAYYGSADATSLFIWLLESYCESQGDWTLMTELKDAWQAACQWIITKLEQGGGWIRFHENENGLVFHGWKDSPKSMCHQDGQIATGDIAVIEIQGYACAALRSAAKLFEKLQDDQACKKYNLKAEQLYDAIQTTFWSNELQYYVMAIDGNNKPLNVISSNPGHLLWTGSVPAQKAMIVKDRLFQDDMWSGWGFRTLASTEVGYNPVSYHNGSVWPHDTALIAWGLNNYGFSTEFQRVADASLELSRKVDDLRLPELISGYSRAEFGLPVPYPGTCKPQAWSAACIPFYTRSAIYNR